MRVAVLGFGLIGGSIARALARRPRAAGAGLSIVAWSPSGAGPVRAVAEGVLDGAPARAEDALAGVDLVVLAAPPLACLDLLASLAGTWRAALPAGATVTDVASTKAALVARAEVLGLRFVGGHPMAGREVAGFGGSRADLFDDRPWVVVPAATAGEGDVARVERLAIACGARPLRLAAAEHDAAAAAVSHLPLVLAAALVESVAGRPGEADPPDWPTARELAAGGWDSATRLARGDATMGAGILATNSGPVAARIRDVQAALGRWLAALEAPDGPDSTALEGRLRVARERLGQAPDRHLEGSADGR